MHPWGWGTFSSDNTIAFLCFGWRCWRPSVAERLEGSVERTLRGRLVTDSDGDSPANSARQPPAGGL